MTGPDALAEIPLTLVAQAVCAGFPSPAEDYSETSVDLSRMLSPTGRRPVFHSLPERDGSRVVHVVDPTLSPRRGDLALVRADGLQRLARVGRAQGRADLTDLSGRPLSAGEVVCVGVATWCLRSFRGGEPGEDGSGLSAGGPSAFLFRVKGHSMREAGIGHGDLLLVDRAERPGHGDVVVAVSDEARSVKRLLVEGGRALLAFENADYPDPLPFQPETVLFGVVTWGLRKLRA
jgi:hypothetical protein